MKIKPSFVLASLMVTQSTLAAGTDISIYPLSFDNKTQQWSIGKGKVITDRDGYDNQASFALDGQSIFFSSNRSGAHTDIYQYQFFNGDIYQVTNTPDESEFSPNETPEGLKYVVEQGVPHQSVWLQKEGKPRVRAINSLIPSGYYAAHSELGTLLWARYAHALYFEPKGEQADERHFVTDHVGRSIHLVPNQTRFSYVKKKMNGDQVVTIFDPKLRSHQEVVSLGSGNEDYAWSGHALTQSTWLFNLDGNELRAWHLEQKPSSTVSMSWQSIKNITPPSPRHHSPYRIAVSPNNRYITIVWSRK
ncbi:TolB family protein [Parashewanella tropica]|uniref:TolB family protein n=1 Tax=Parashewanella tropica TaxID=2547970 RepID=UPI00105A1266|nr:PD40 domain-containing protein [Parashewanella tropica]